MTDPRRIFGNEGEALAAEYLARKGFVVTARQYKTRGGEVDLVCLDGTEAVFVEVKARRSDAYGYPEASVTPKKLRRIARAAEQFMREHAWEARSMRVDVVAIEWTDARPVVTHIDGIDMTGIA